MTTKAEENAAAVHFGLTRGWKLSQSPFGLRTLAKGRQHDGGQGWTLRGRRKNPDVSMFHRQFDHPYFYRRDRKAAAIAAHLYDMPGIRGECEMIAAQFGLVFEVPDLPSWWYPGWATLVVYVGPRGLENDIAP